MGREKKGGRGGWVERRKEGEGGEVGEGGVERRKEGGVGREKVREEGGRGGG